MFCVAPSLSLTKGNVALERPNEKRSSRPFEVGARWSTDCTTSNFLFFAFAKVFSVKNVMKPFRVHEHLFIKIGEGRVNTLFVARADAWRQNMYGMGLITEYIN